METAENFIELLTLFLDLLNFIFIKKHFNILLDYFDDYF